MGDIAVFSMTLQNKLISCFMAISGITIFVGMFAVLQVKDIEYADARLYEKATAPMKDLISITENFQKIRIAIQNLAIDDEIKDFTPFLKEIEHCCPAKG